MYAFLSLLTQIKCERIEAFMKDFSITHRLNPPVKPFQKKKKRERNYFLIFRPELFKLYDKKMAMARTSGRKEFVF